MKERNEVGWRITVDGVPVLFLENYQLRLG